MERAILAGSIGDGGDKQEGQKAGNCEAERKTSRDPPWLPPWPPPDISISPTCPQAFLAPGVLLAKHQLQKPSRLLLDPWVYQASMASLVSQGNLEVKAL